MNPVFEDKSPVIRFKEFKKCWTFESLNCVASRVSKKNINLDENRVLTNSAKFGIVLQQNFFDKEIGKLENLTGYYKVEINDFVYNPRISRYASAGPVNRNKLTEGVVSPLYSVFRFFEGDLDFLEQYFKSTKWHRHIKKVANYGARFDRMNITIRDLFALPVPVIEVREQEKIASFLSSVDTRIEQLERKKLLLEQYKKGLMQKLFSQEIRFKDDEGKDYPEWVRETFGNLYCFKSTNSFSREKMNHSLGTVRNIHYGDIHTKFKAQFELKRESVPFLNTDVDINNLSDDMFCKEGDLVIADASEDYVGIGKTIELLNLENQKVLAGLHTLLARLISDQIYVGFSAFMMECWFVRHQIMKNAQGTKVLGISMGRLCRVQVPLPSREEQQNIADFLSTIDRKIELVSEQISRTKEFKKGLLQQMFV